MPIGVEFATTPLEERANGRCPLHRSIGYPAVVGSLVPWRHPVRRLTRRELNTLSTYVNERCNIPESCQPKVPNS